MKKISIILIMIVALASCSKEDLVKTTVKTGLNTSANTKTSTTHSKMTTYHDNGTVWGCWGEPTNCFEPIIVHGDKIKLINNLFSVVKSANQREIIRFFEENKDELALFFDKETINNVINGTLVAKDKDENAQNERFILFVLPTTGEIINVNPFVKE